MRVSALIPTYNRRHYVPRAVASVLSQTVPVSEIIVVDDGSTDDTADLLAQQFGGKVRIVRQTNQGVSNARRRAVREATGEWVAFLDSDDEWTPDRNRLLTEATSLLPEEVAWIFGDVCLVQDKADDETIFKKFGLKLDKSPHLFRDSMQVQHPFQFGLLQASLMRRQPLIEVDAFGAGLRHSEDFLTGVQIACRYKVAAIEPVVTRMHRTSDLEATSLDLAGRNSDDYHRARMLAFSLILQSGRGGRWGELYAEAVRGLCKNVAERGGAVRNLSLEQFRYGITGKSVAFGCAAMFGTPGLKLWKQIGRASRRLRGQEEFSVMGIGWNS